MNTHRITMPTKTLLQGCLYRPAVKTDVRVTWAIAKARELLENKK